MNLSTIRVLSILVAAPVVCILGTGVAFGAEPKAGKYAGEDDSFEIDFKVQDPGSKPSKVQGFEFSGPICTSEPGAVNSVEVPKAMKVKPSGTFAFSGEGESEEIEGDFYVDAKFTASKTATGTLVVSACPLAGEFEYVIKKGGGDEISQVSAFSVPTVGGI